MKTFFYSIILSTLFSTLSNAQAIIDFSLIAQNTNTTTTVEHVTNNCPELAKLLPTNPSQDVLALLQVLATANKPVVVKLSATWCGPCKKMETVIHEAAQELGDIFLVIEVDIDKFPSVRKLYDIAGVPTLIYYVHGSEATTRTHGMSKDQFKNLINKLVSRSKK